MYSSDDLLAGARSGLIRSDPDVLAVLHPQLILNDPSKGRKTLEFILENLNLCYSFRFAVAFITRSGVACIYQALKEFSVRGGKGEILVSSYLNFSDPHAIQILRCIPGISIKFVSANNFHGKTFLFEFENYSRLLVGSSNLTQDALGRNTEINLTVSLMTSSTLYQSVDLSLNLWSEKANEITDISLSEYSQLWKLARQSERNSIKSSGDELITVTSFNPIEPNSMQSRALAKIDAVRKSGQRKTLVVSATGTGKTVLSALDVKQMGAGRLLFVVHRLNIAKKAMSEFRKVFGDTKSMALYSGSEELNTGADFIFSTVQTINAEHHISKFEPTAFDYIIIDESHRAGAAVYLRVLNYFKPKFLLGMTATPERTDGFDIFSLFDHSIAYEIRLQAAMEADLLAPFHYFGISDLFIDDASRDDVADFAKLTSDQRINHIINTLNEYGCDTGIPRGLVFCSRVDEAMALAKAFEARGIKSLALSGSDPESFREKAIERLESNGPEKLDYLFTVDIFNEGVDIPAVNQVVMLRPTTSAIIFVQQLGRGLRKSAGKEYLTIIDFIGNYSNNYLIPIALFGDSSYNKDKLRRLLSAGSSLIPGSSSISFERIARERIFASIDSAKINTSQALSHDYKLLKFRIGKTPLMVDFIEHNSRDPYQYVEHSGSLLNFSRIQDPSIAVPDTHVKLISYLSKHVCDGKRLEDSAILKLILTKGRASFSEVGRLIESLAKYYPSDKVINSAIHSINLNYATQRSQNQNLPISEIIGFKLLSVQGNEIFADSSLLEVIGWEQSKQYYLDLAECGIRRFLDDYSPDVFNLGFKRGGKYSRKDVFRILEWDRRPNEQNVGGYIVSPDGTNCPIFATYDKSEGISDTINYQDRFVNPSHLIYMSKNRRNLNSPDVMAIRNQEASRMRIPFFPKKNDDEGLDFYYLGDLQSIPQNFENATMSIEGGTQVSVVKMEFILDKPVEYRLYKYITDETSTIEHVTP